MLFCFRYESSKTSINTSHYGPLQFSVGYQSNICHSTPLYPSTYKTAPQPLAHPISNASQRYHNTPPYNNTTMPFQTNPPLVEIQTSNPRTLAILRNNVITDSTQINESALAFHNLFQTLSPKLSMREQLTHLFENFGFTYEDS